MSWDDVLYRLEALPDRHIDEFIGAFARIYSNGGVVVRSFRAADDAEFDRAIQIDARGVERTALSVVSSPSVINAVPELRIPLPLERPPEFRSTSLFGMEGELTQMLVQGGAYERFPGTVDDARGITRRFMEGLFGMELHLVGWAVVTATAWTPWFCNIAWDATFVVQDRRTKRYVLVCMTDTD